MNIVACLFVNLAEDSQSEPAMPFMQPALSENKIETIVRWIEQGAPQGDVEINGWLGRLTSDTYHQGGNFEQKPCPGAGALY